MSKIYKPKEINIEHIIFKKPICIGNNMYKYPIKYLGNDLIIQTPIIFIPFGLSMYNNKTYLDISFININKDKEMNSFKKSIDHINTCGKNKINKKNKKLKFTNSIKKSTNLYPDRFRLCIKDDIMVFNEHKDLIQFDYIQPKMYVKVLIHPECIWCNEETFGITWNVVQLKLYNKLILNTYSFIDDEPSNEENVYKNDPKYEKYFKMLKMGVPVDAIKHKMICDNLDPNIIDCPKNSILNTNKIIKNTHTNSVKSLLPPPPPPLPASNINIFSEIKKAKLQKTNKKTKEVSIPKDTPMCFRPSSNEILQQLKKLKKAND